MKSALGGGTSHVAPSRRGGHSSRRPPVVVTRHYNLVLLIALIMLTVACRYIGKHYFQAGNKIDVPMPTTSTFANATKPIFFFDLGGTLCMCEKKWVVSEYWSKVFSGFAFNFAHVVGTFEFYVLMCNWKVILIAVFINEMIEELWLTSGYWGFTLDPPYDQEARYDSLIRDTICCMLGIHLAVTYGKLMRVQPLVKWPIRWNFCSDEPPNPHHATRWLKFGVQAGCMWQITLIFNADKGPFHFNANNVFLIMCYTSAVFIFYLWNVNDYPEMSRLHVFALYAGWAGVIAVVFGFAIYPVFSSAMYLIICVESFISLTFTAVKLLFRLRPDIAKRVFGPSANPAAPDLGSAPLDVEKPVVRLETISQDSEASEACLGDEIPQFKLLELLQVLDSLDFEGVRAVTMNELGDAISNLRQKYLQPKQTSWSWRKDYGIVVSVVVRITIICIAASQPMLWHGIQYKRHWCGNPNVGWGNGCP